MYPCIVEVLNITSGNQSSFLCSEILTLHHSVNSKCKKLSKNPKLSILKAQAYVCLGVLMLEDKVHHAVERIVSGKATLLNAHSCFQLA